MKPITDTRKIAKAAKAAGIELIPGKGSHFKLIRSDGKHESLSNVGKKETSKGVATKCWLFIQEAERERALAACKQEESHWRHVCRGLPVLSKETPGLKPSSF